MDTKWTNNGPEAFHSHFNGQFYSAHPPIYVFLDVLLKQQTVTYINIRGLDVVAAIRREEKEKTDCSIEQFQKFENGEMTRQQFFKAHGI